MVNHQTTAVRRAVLNIFSFVLVALILSLFVVDIVFRDEITKRYIALEAAHPILLPFVLALFSGGFAWWIIADIRQEKKSFAEIYFFRVILFVACFLIFGIQAFHAIAKTL